jgi:hypothetical protein
MQLIATLFLVVAAILWLIDHFVVSRYPLLRASVGCLIVTVALFQFGERLIR